jgi:tubulin monoglycylase TTLL15
MLINFSRAPNVVKIVLLFGAVILFFNFVVIWRVIKDSNYKEPAGKEEHNECYQKKQPIVWIHAKKELAMSHVSTVFDRLGYGEVSPGGPWDVMWSHGYPYTTDVKNDLKHLQPYQKVNHFPGTGCFVSKPKLSTQGFPFTPKTFRLPHELDKLMQEAKSRPDAMWVQKSNTHRGIRVIKVDKTQNVADLDSSIVQEFIRKPLLIDGRAFDVGIYTVITSVNPLRVYVYGEEILWRFCAKDYYPFNFKNKKSYVVDDNYTPAWDIPSLRPLIRDKGLSHKEVFNHVLKMKGFRPEVFWNTAHSIIQKVLYHCEISIVNYTKSYADSRNFFEFIRFDFIIDEALNIWLMEVNLSPNLSSSHTTDNRFMYEQVIFNVLKIVGLARESYSSFGYNGQYESIMLVNEHDIQVPLNICIDNTCANDCHHNIVREIFLCE